MSAGGARRGWAWPAVVVSLLVLVTAVATFPAVLFLRGLLVGDAWDGRMFLWQVAHVASALAEGSSPLWTRQLYAPEGVSLAVQPNVLLPAAVVAPVTWSLGPVVAYDALVLATFVLAGLCMYGLAREQGLSRWSALVAGAVFSVGAIRMSKLPFLNLLQSYWVPALPWAALVLVRRPSSRAALVFGAAVGGCFLSSYNLTVIAAFVVLPLLLVGGGSRRGEPLRAGHVLCAALAFVVVALPLAVPLAREVAREGFYASLGLQASDEATDLSVFVRDWPVWGRGPDGGRFHLRQTAYVGGFSLLLAGVGLWRGRRDRRPRGLAVAAAAFFVLSLGPKLVVAGFDTGLALPFDLVRRLPVLGEVRIAHRWTIAFWTCMCLLVGHGAMALEAGARRFRRGAGTVAVVVVGTLTWMEHVWIPVPLVTPVPRVPAVVDGIGLDPRDGLVLEVMGGRFGYSGYSWFQIRHGRGVLEGQLSRTPPSAQARVDASPLLRPFRRVAAGQEEVPPAGSPTARAMAAEARRLRVRWVMVPLVRDNLFTPASHDLLLRLDRMVRACLPVRAVLFELPAVDEEAERALLGRPESYECYGGAYLWRVFELELPERP